jgi:hypothetical protein
MKIGLIAYAIDLAALAKNPAWRRDGTATPEVDPDHKTAGAAF